MIEISKPAPHRSLRSALNSLVAGEQLVVGGDYSRNTVQHTCSLLRAELGKCYTVHFDKDNKNFLVTRTA